MKVLVATTEDKASINIRDRLMEEADWEPVGELDGRPVLSRQGYFLLTLEGMHLDMDHVDSKISNALRTMAGCGVEGGRSQLGPLDLMVFLSKHRSEKEVSSLTVHPPGNYLDAKFGGLPSTLPPSAPREMTCALRSMDREARALGVDDQITFEVTHHGPFLDSPCFFIEIGSSEARWERPELGRAIARSLLSPEFTGPVRTNDDIAIGIGGGHYAPRFTEKALKEKIAFGHMVPDHVLTACGDPMKAIDLAISSTPGATCAVLHRSKRNEKLIDVIGAELTERGIHVII